MKRRPNIDPAPLAILYLLAAIAVSELLCSPKTDEYSRRQDDAPTAREIFQAHAGEERTQ